MSKLPRWSPSQKITGDDLNLLAAALDSGGVTNSVSTTTIPTTGAGLTPTFPSTPGSTTPPPGTGGSPSTPTGLTLSSSIDYFSQTHIATVILTWTPNPVSDFVSRYDIYWHKPGDSILHNFTVGGDVTATELHTFQPGQTYVFAIQAHDAAGRGSNWSPEVTITISLDIDSPAIPTNLTATATALGEIHLTWTEVGAEGLSPDLKQYQIAISTDGGVTYPTIKTVGPQNSFYYTPLSPLASPTFFKVAAVDWTGNTSAYSAPVSASTGTLSFPNVVGGLTLLTGDLTITNGNIFLNASTSNINGGTGGIRFRDSTNTKTNLDIRDGGAITIRNSLKVPASANATIPSTNYGTLPVLIDSQSPTVGGVTSFSFINPLPTGFTNLRIVYYAVNANSGTGVDLLQIRFNNDSSSKYYSDRVAISGTGAWSNAVESLAATWGIVGFVAQGGIGVGGAEYACGEFRILGYNAPASTAKWFGSCSVDTGNATGNIQFGNMWGHWVNSAAAITQITLSTSGTFVFSGITNFELWGEP